MGRTPFVEFSMIDSSLPKSVADKTVRTLLDQWLQDLRYRRARSPATVVAYEGDVRHFLTFLQGYRGERVTLAGLRTLKAVDWRAWLAQQRNNVLTAQTTARRLSALKSFYRFLSQEGLVEDPPVLSARPPKVPRKLPRPLFFEDIQSLMASCSTLPGEPWIIKRDEALIFLLYGLGLRINEALSLNAEDLRDENLRIQGKRNKMRQVPLLPLLRQKIAEYQKAYALAHGGAKLNQGALFLGQKGKRLLAPVFEARIHRLRDLLNLPQTATPHALRHSCASHLMANSNDLRGIQELLGHASLSSTQIYTKLENDQLMEAYQQAHPRALEARKATEKVNKEKGTEGS